MLGLVDPLHHSKKQMLPLSFLIFVLSKHVDGVEVLFCSKVREGDKRVVRVAEGDPQGKHVFIVDDLCNTGRQVFKEWKLVT